MRTACSDHKAAWARSEHEVTPQMTALAEATEGNFPSRDRRPHPDRTVSREHAHIAFHKRSGEYRLYNDRWYKQGHNGDGGCGLWIIRDGLSQEVHRNARGGETARW